uniref:Uncharacterized protein n=1 Tax=Cacopsylla melanoneura TaxID=428564 RepID=A0A8D8XYU7_9HEMI
MFHQSSLSIQVYRVAQLKSYKAISRKTYKIEKCFQSKIFMDLWETSLNDLGFTLKVVLQGQAKVDQGQGKVIKIKRRLPKRHENFACPSNRPTALLLLWFCLLPQVTSMELSH